MYTIVVAIAVSLVVIVAVTIAFEREVSTFESFMILLVVYSATRIILRALTRRGGEGLNPVKKAVPGSPGTANSMR